MDGELIFVALSGGVDSAVCALLLQKQGYKVHAIHMQNWDPEVNGEDLKTLGNGCTNKKELNDAQEIAKLLNIPLTVYNFVPEYWENVFEPFIEDMKNNLITNPDILCNSKIKFGVLLEQLKKDFGQTIKLATGHYAKVICEEKQYFLGTCLNKKKDQTYFLSRLNKEQLKHITFPLHIFKDKSEVREIAKKNNLFNWNKTNTRGICFIGKRNFKSFMSIYLQSNQGKIIDIEDNRVLGEHSGLNFYALHQRDKLNISGQKEKYYVCKKNYEKNILYLCPKSKIEDYLYTNESWVNDLYWINELPKQNDELFIKAKHGNHYIKIKISEINENNMKIIHKKQFVTTPGQYIVFYNIAQTICLGSAIYATC